MVAVEQALLNTLMEPLDQQLEWHVEYKRRRSLLTASMLSEGFMGSAAVKVGKARIIEDAAADLFGRGLELEMPLRLLNNLPYIEERIK